MLKQIGWSFDYHSISVKTPFSPDTIGTSPREGEAKSFPPWGK